MAVIEELIHRQVFTTDDGAKVLVRPLTRGDRQDLLNLFLPVGPEEKQYIRHDVNDPKVIQSWIDTLDYGNVLPLVAVVDQQIIGIASLHFRSGPERHRAEVRIFLTSHYRNRGIGKRMLSGLIEVARRRQLLLLEVEIVNDQTLMLSVFQDLGFESKCVLSDFYIMPDGELKDVTYMVYSLVSSS